jgi:hypothetical protein
MSYSAFGLNIRSSIALSGYLPADIGRNDVTIACIEGPESEWTSSVRDRDFTLEIKALETRFWFKEVGTCVVQDGTTITITPRKGVDRTLLRLYVEGMMMAMLLHQRGMCVLHASVIELQGAAVACLGHIGAGKSSTAAALYARGHRILTDDNAAIQLGTGVPLVVPGYPYVKLFPSIAASLGFEGSNLAILHETQAKMAGAVTRGFSDRALPLRTIYILGHDHAPEITQLSPLDATIQLIRNAVPTRWGHPGDGRQLQQCAAIANQVPAFAVRTFRDIAELPGMVDHLECHQSVYSALEQGVASGAP